MYLYSVLLYNFLHIIANIYKHYPTLNFLSYYWKGSNKPSQNIPLWYVNKLSWKQLRSSRFKKYFFNYPKESREGACPRKTAITRDYILSEWSVCMIGQTSDYQTICSSHHPVDYPSPWPVIPFLHSGWHISINCPTCPSIPYLWGPCTYISLFFSF